MKELPAELRASILQEVNIFYTDYVETTTRRTPMFLSAGYSLLANSCALDDMAEEDFSNAMLAQSALDTEEKRILIQIFKRTLNNASPFSISARFSPTQDTQKNQIKDFMRQFEHALDDTFTDSTDKALVSEEAEAISALIPVPSAVPAPSESLSSLSNFI